MDAIFNWSLLPNAFSVIADSAKDYLTILVPLSLKLLSIAVLISGSWLLLKESLTNSPRNAIAALMLLLMQAAIALAVITQWSTLAQIPHNLATDIAQAMGGGDSALMAVLNPIAKHMADISDYIVTTPFEIPEAPATTGPWGIFAVIVFYIKEMFMALITAPITAILSVISILLLGLVVALVAGAIMFAEISLVVGLVAAPFMIAMNFFPYINFTIDGWVRFILGAIMLKMVAMLVGLVMGAALGAVLAPQMSENGTFGYRLATMIFISVIAGMFVYAAIKIDDIARALMSGGVVGGPGARVVSSGMAISGQSAAGVAGGGVTGAARGAVTGTGTIKGAIRGAAGRSGASAYAKSIRPRKPK